MLAADNWLPQLRVHRPFLILRSLHHMEHTEKRREQKIRCIERNGQSSTLPSSSSAHVRRLCEYKICKILEPSLYEVIFFPFVFFWETTSAAIS